MSLLPSEEILACSPSQPPADPQTIGRSRQGREIIAYRRGHGRLRVSLVGGCHADEPVGPAMLRRLAHYLASCPSHAPAVRGFSWWIVPHVNPDGEARNLPWTAVTLTLQDHLGTDDDAFDPYLYVQLVVRELPGDDVEFGFPRDPFDHDARPENRAVARFVGDHGPFDLHASFHGMGFAPGPWFLIEPAWIERTSELRELLRQQVAAMGYPLFDVDRRGEKGFHRIDAGFCTRPDSRAMAAHFMARNEPETAAWFRPSSMEHIRGLGGDPLTLVSEMPLFLTPEAADHKASFGFRAGSAGRRRLLEELSGLVAARSETETRRQIAALGIRPMPIRDQMRLQLAFLSEALSCVSSQP